MNTVAAYIVGKPRTESKTRVETVVWGCLSINILAYQHRDTHHKDKMISRPSCLYDRNLLTWKYSVYIAIGPWPLLVVVKLDNQLLVDHVGGLPTWVRSPIQDAGLVADTWRCIWKSIGPHDLYYEYILLTTPAIKGTECGLFYYSTTTIQ